ncbi:MAG: Hpt domain-containing protein [Alphaproteobacteria bacterium]|nr:Hpt domain-containing protein [Alphaproteobacteria bacterium]
MAREKLPEIPADASKSWHAVIDRPNDLSRKVLKSGGVEPEKAFLAADAIVKQMTSEYIDKLAEDIQQMNVLAAKYRKDNSEETLDRLFRLIHNMRGQGATFGFPLITEIGRHFCRYVRERPKRKAVKPALVDQHLKAMHVVYNQSIKGSGDEISQAVVNALAEVVDRELA